MKKIMIIPLFLLIIFFSSVDAFDDPSKDMERDFRLFELHSMSLYFDYARVQMSLEEIRKLMNDVNIEAKFWGYALSNQKRYARGTAERSVYKSLEQRITSHLKECANKYLVETEAIRKDREMKALQVFVDASSGIYNSEMENLTGVNPKVVPNFFTYRKNMLKPVGPPELKTGYYRNTIGDSGYIKYLGGREYEFELWEGKERKPKKDNWYNKGGGFLALYEGGQYLIHSIHGAQEGHPFSEYTFEGYWKIINSETLLLVKYRNYLTKKDGHVTDDWGWKKESIYYNLVKNKEIR